MLPAQARAAGVDRRAIAQRVSRRIWRRHMGCLLLDDPGSPRDAHVLDAWAITLRCRPGPVFVSGSTALALAGRKPPDTVAPVRIAIVPTHRCRRLDGVHLHVGRPGNLRARTHPGGLLCQPAAHALLDIVEVLDPKAAKPWLDWALLTRVLTASDIRRALSAPLTAGPYRERKRTSGRTRAARLRLALAHAEGGTRSEAERVMRALLREHRILGFVGDYPASMAPDERPFARLDFADEKRKIAIEVDGRAFHSAGQAFVNDRVRQNRLMGLGWTVLRFTWEMLLHDPAGVATEVRRVVRSREPSK